MGPVRLERPWRPHARLVAISIPVGIPRELRSDAHATARDCTVTRWRRSCSPPFRPMPTLTYPPPRQWRSPFHSMAWKMSTVGLVAFGGWLIFATTSELNRAAQTPPAPPQVVRDIVVRDAPDQSGRLASFRILLLSDEFRWRLNSYEEVERESEQPLFTPEMKKVLAKAEEVICVGASSEEIPAGYSPTEGRAREERRAARRADQNRLLGAQRPDEAGACAEAEHRPPCPHVGRSKHFGPASRRDYPRARPRQGHQRRRGASRGHAA